MPAPSDRRRRRDRHILGVCIAIAAALHVVVIGLVSWTRAGAEFVPGSDAVVLEPDPWTGTAVDVFFGPPGIRQPDGSTAREPDDRVLAAKRLMQVPPICLSRAVPSAPGAGEIRLTVNAAGRVDLAELTQSLGDACWDRVALRVAADLWYRWLPNETYPAPVEVLQPLTVGLVVDP